MTEKEKNQKLRMELDMTDEDYKKLKFQQNRPSSEYFERMKCIREKREREAKFYNRIGFFSIFIILVLLLIHFLTFKC